jgi:hypothetical protein
MNIINSLHIQNTKHLKLYDYNSSMNLVQDKNL